MAEPQQAPQPQFTIEKIYVKDASLEIPNAPQIFLERATPELEFSFRTEGQSIGNDYHEVALTATVTAKLKEQDKTVFLIEASQGGIFLVRGVPEGDMEMVYGITCPTILLPYLRETISDMAVRAGFPPVFLAPMNFEALFRQRQEGDPSTSRPPSELTH
ncbi:MAG: protein-export chaperone SecB [Betaproteobacteria bacterium]|jgi:preprotein translocase subunit SecB